MNWGVWSVVSGGVTGHRESWLKVNGRRVEYSNVADAEEAAKNARDSVRSFAVARFHYYVKRIDADGTQ